MHVALRLKRKLHVYDAAHVRHVDAAACDVRSDKDADGSLAEAFEGAGALALRLVGVDGRALLVGAQELLDDTVCPVAHLGEHDHLRPFGMFVQEMQEKRVLLRLFDEHHLLVDLLDGRRLGGYRHLYGVCHQLARELHYLRREGRREEERLAGLRKLRYDALYVRQKAHVEHSVGLVQHEALHLVEVDYALRHQVYQSAWAGDHRLGASLDVLDLSELAHTAEDARERDVGVLGVGADVLCGLRGELAGRRKHESAGVPDMARTAHLDEMVKYRQHEGGGLARAGLGAAYEVAAFKEVRHRLLLDGGRRLVACIGYGVLKLLVELSENGSFKHHTTGFMYFDLSARQRTTQNAESGIASSMPSRGPSTVAQNRKLNMTPA